MTKWNKYKIKSKWIKFSSFPIRPKKNFTKQQKLIDISVAQRQVIWFYGQQLTIIINGICKQLLSNIYKYHITHKIELLWWFFHCPYSQLNDVFSGGGNNAQPECINEKYIDSKKREKWIKISLGSVICSQRYLRIISSLGIYKKSIISWKFPFESHFGKIYRVLLSETESQIVSENEISVYALI